MYFTLGTLLVVSHQLRAETDTAATFRVMLQGSSQSAFHEIVEAANDVGAEITHELPLINAVGARVSTGQLSQISELPAITRLIDDLDVTAPAPEEEPEDAECTAAAALELVYQGSETHWQLYNKGDAPLSLRSITAAWPEELGPLDALLWSETPFDVDETQAPGEAREKMFTPRAPQILEGQSDLGLALRFRKHPDPENQPQRDFTIKAEFRDDCLVELIPGYPDNRADTYYPTVTGADMLHRHGITGAGITVAVLDSGLWETGAITNDTRGKPRILAHYNAIADREGESFDESGHGTHLTSIIAQSGMAMTAAGGSYRGVAPDVSLVSIKSFGADGQGDFLDIVRGLQWVYDNHEKYDIRILNLSFAARPRWPYWLDPINQAVMRIWQAGVVVVAAAGNEGPEAMSIGSPGNLPYIITVGSVTDSWTTDTYHDDYIPDYSSRGPTPSGHIKPDIVAPGGHMSGFTRPGSTLQADFPEYLLSTGDFVMTGTSQSAALVSGLAALLLQIEPDLSPDDLKCMLTSSANPAINLDGKLSYSPFQQGSGYVDLQRAITFGERGCGNVGMDIDSEIRGEQFFRGPAVIDDATRPTLPDLELIYDDVDPEKGLSADRRWGVKAHIERLQNPNDEGAQPRHGQDWLNIYESEKSLIEHLRGQN